MAVFMSRAASCVALVSSSIFAAEGNAFLGRDLPHLRMNVDHLLEDLEVALGTAHREKVEARVSVMQEAMRPTFQALPRNHDDKLEPNAVRYLLHRFFIDRHGWSVEGFDTEGEAWNSSSATDAFANHAEVAQVFDNRMSRGLLLREVALLAATLESLVHVETVKRLHASYSLLDLEQVENHPTENQAVEALDLHMLMHMLGRDPGSIKKEDLTLMRNQIQSAFPQWPETKKWLHEVRKEVLAETPEDRTSFSASVRVVETAADRYGKWQDRECIDLKESMLKLERVGTGRVPLTTFYNAALGGMWQFSESKEYLKHIGALDETDVNRPSVIIPNYVNAPTNCVGGSKYYSVCCINECEDLLAHLERQIAAPTASVERILELVQRLPSATEDVPRVLSEQLVKRLQEIADRHSGVVPLHARLFNQWMHHAYPRECPYPHLSGSKYLKPEEFAEKTGSAEFMSADDMKEALALLGDESDHILNDELPWTSDEECFLGEYDSTSQTWQAMEGEDGSSSSVRGLMFCVVASSLAWTLVRMLTQAKAAFPAEKQKDLYV